MKGLGSVASVIEALHEDVEAEAARIRRQSEDEQRLLAEAAAAEPVAIADRRERLEDERRKAAELASREDWTDRREALEERERFVAEVTCRGLARLAAPDDRSARSAWLCGLIAESFAHLPGDDFEVIVRAADRDLVAGDLAAVEERCGKRRLQLSAETLPGIGGVIVRACDGRTALDNRVESRMRRFESAWLAAVVEIYGP